MLVSKIEPCMSQYKLSSPARRAASLALGRDDPAALRDDPTGFII